MSTEDQPNTILDVYTPFAWVQEVGGSNFTKAQADQLYLRKTVEDTDPNIANFTAGIRTNSITSVAGNISLGQTTTTTQDPNDNTTKIATTAWVKLQGYLTSIALAGYATEAWVLGRNYITASALAGYATETYVTTRGYITASALVGYATETYVTTRGYITSAALAGYALESWVTAAISSALTGYATETYVTTRGYITSSALVGYATETYVTTRGYLTNSIFTSNNSWSGTNNFSVSGSLTCANPPSGSTGVQVVNADWVLAKGYLTTAILTGYATEAWVLGRNYITSSALAGYAQLAVANTWNLLQTFTSGIATNSITSISGNISLGTATTTTQVSGTDNATIATTAYVKSQNYGSKDAYNTWNYQQSLQGGLSVSTITNYFVGAVSLSATTGATTLAPGAGDNTTRIPTTAWVTTHVTSALVGYATETYVTTRGYITSAALSGYALLSGTNTWTGAQALSNGGTVSVLTGATSSEIVNAAWVIAKGYATETFVTTRGYITTYAGIFVSNNSWSGTNNFTGSGNLTCTTPAGASTGNEVVNAAWVLAKGYVSSAAQLTIAQTWTALQYFSAGLRTGSIIPPVGGVIDIGSATTITQVAGTNNTSLATTAFVLGQGFATGVNTYTAYSWTALQSFYAGMEWYNILSKSLINSTGIFYDSDYSSSSSGTKASIGSSGLLLTTKRPAFFGGNLVGSMTPTTITLPQDLGGSTVITATQITPGGDFFINAHPFNLRMNGGVIDIGDTYDSEIDLGGNASNRAQPINIGSLFNTSGSAPTTANINIQNGTYCASGVNILSGTGATGNITLGASDTQRIIANSPIRIGYSPITSALCIGGTRYDAHINTSISLISSNPKTFCNIDLNQPGWYMVTISVVIIRLQVDSEYYIYVYSADTPTTNGGSIPATALIERFSSWKGCVNNSIELSWTFTGNGEFPRRYVGIYLMAQQTSVGFLPSLDIDFRLTRLG